MGRPGARDEGLTLVEPLDEGFTLVEVMVAMAIFLVVSAAALGLVMRALGTVRGNADRVYAAALARSEVESLRTLGSAAIPLGSTTRTATTDAGTFIVTRTATWISIGAPTNPCDVGPGVTPGKSYLRLRVDVEGGDLQAPQTVDAVVYPSDTAPTENTGTITVEVDDNLGEPVPGVTVTGSNGAGQTFQQVTGPDGCVFVPDLKAGAGWSVAIAKAGYITEQLNGESQGGVVVNELQNTPLTFAYAAAGTLVFTAGSGDFPVPTAMPFTFSPDTRNRKPSSFSTYPVTVTGLWPASYTAWLRPCATAADGSTSSATLDQGTTTTVALGGARVEVVGPKGAAVTATYSGACSVTYALGTVASQPGLPNTLLPVTATLPAGRWTIGVAGASPASTVIELAQTTSLCSVKWTWAESVTQAQYDALLAQGFTVADLASLQITPGVSAPCPTVP